jgi:hypothetical protein
VSLTGFRRCVFAVCLCGQVLDVAPRLPDNSPADGATARSLLDDPTRDKADPSKGRRVLEDPVVDFSTASPYASIDLGGRSIDSTGGDAPGRRRRSGKVAEPTQ